MLQGDDAVATCPDFEVRVTADAERLGLVELRFALRQDAVRQEVVLGNAKLTVGPGPDAVWKFEAAPRAPRER